MVLQGSKKTCRCPINTFRTFRSPSPVSLKDTGRTRREVQSPITKKRPLRPDQPDNLDVVVLELRPLPGSWRTPPILRLRALLKAVLSGYGFRCVGVKPKEGRP
jgi:hypothetical protein